MCKLFGLFFKKKIQAYKLINLILKLNVSKQFSIVLFCLFNSQRNIYISRTTDHYDSTYIFLMLQRTISRLLCLHLTNVLMDAFLVPKVVKA